MCYKLGFMSMRRGEMKVVWLQRCDHIRTVRQSGGKEMTSVRGRTDAWYRTRRAMTREMKIIKTMTFIAGMDNGKSEMEDDRIYSSWSPIWEKKIIAVWLKHLGLLTNFYYLQFYSLTESDRTSWKVDNFTILFYCFDLPLYLKEHLVPCTSHHNLTS